jgi:hypothetical protein
MTAATILLEPEQCVMLFVDFQAGLGFAYKTYQIVGGVVGWKIVVGLCFSTQNKPSRVKERRVWARRF